MSQDRELDKYLEGKSDLSQMYADMPEIELPNHLDAAILAEAHRVVGARPGAKPKRRWTIPLGMVATLFVAVMIGLQLPNMLNDVTSPQQYKEERAAAMMDKSMTERSSAAPEESMKARELAIMPTEKSAGTRGNPAPMAAEAEVPAGQNAPILAAPSVAVPTPAAAAKRMELRESADIDSGMARAKEKKFSGQAQDSMSDSQKPPAPAAATMAAPAPVQLNRSLTQSLKDEASDASLTPEEWLVRIRRLKHEGKLDEAQKDLAAFRNHYPNFPVPKDLEVR